MPKDHGSPPPHARQPVFEMDGCEVREPGCYLHLASGLLTRIYPDELREGTVRSALYGGGRVAHLSADPAAPLHLLRALASSRKYPVNF